MNRKIGSIATPGLALAVLFRRESFKIQLFQQLEVMGIHLGPVRHLFTLHILLDTIDRD